MRYVRNDTILNVVHVKTISLPKGVRVMYYLVVSLVYMLGVIGVIG